MGYRALLKSYIRHLEVVAGDHYIDSTGGVETLNGRERSELRLLAAEVDREAYRRPHQEDALLGTTPAGQTNER